MHKAAATRDFFSVVLADPAELSLAFTRVDTGKAGPDKYRVSYSRGTSSDESVNHARLWNK